MFLRDDLKALLDIKGTEFDTILQDIVEGVLEEADEFMGLAYSLVTEQVQYFDGGGSTLYLGHANVSNVTVVEDEVTLAADDDYMVYPERGVIRHKTGAFATGLRNVVVTYDGGYSEDLLPKSLKRKLIKQASYEFRRRQDAGLSSVQFPDGSVQKFAMGEWLPDVEQELNRRRRIFL
jgi:hypothetical protein